MPVFEILNVKISGLATAVPTQIKSNDELENHNEEEISLLKETTGISKRRIAQEYQSAADFCFEAANKLLLELDWARHEIDVLVFVSQTPTQQVPGDGTSLQNKLGLSKSCIVLDLNMGCSGYVYGLSVISSFMNAAKLKKGLLLVGDTISKILDPTDKATVPIFSDGGSATSIEYDEKAIPIQFNLESDGLKFESIFQEINGTLKMKGHDVYYYAASVVPKNIKELLSHAKLETEDVDYFVFHQANLLLNESIRRKLKLSKNKVPYSLFDFGNTSCATIPITLVHNLKSELQNKKLNYLLSGFGVGMSCGSAIINISDIVCLEMIEV